MYILFSTCRNDISFLFTDTLVKHLDKSKKRWSDKENDFIMWRIKPFTGKQEM